MRRRFFADLRPGGNRAEITGPNAAHLARVLRVQLGQEFELAAGDGLYLGRVASVGSDAVSFDLIEALPLPPPAPPLEIAPALFKYDHFEWMLEKATELGVTRIWPIVARRTEPRLAQAAPARMQRWRAMVRAAAEQSRRLTPPGIEVPRSLSALLASPPLRRRILLSEDFAAPALESQLASAALHHRNDEGLLMLTGPEGGWAPEEVQAAAAAGFVAVSLGPRILRCETAVIAALARAGAHAA